MRKSSSIRLGLLLAAAAGCNGGNRRCVDEEQRTVDPALCLDGDAGTPPLVGRHYHYWYGGSTFFSGRVYGGSSYGGPSSLHSSGGSASESGVARGGFGSTGAAHSAGSSGGAHGGSAAGS
ncbi:MAG TPA: hypothetical protein VN874_04845 [Myxococcales bacterium]|jgi:hypothetical protein|nr:hypothetical protein [Myxococcales bacterium]